MQGTDDTNRLALEAANQRALVRFAWIFGCGLGLALAVPQAFFAAAISSITGIAAGIMATIALLGRDNVFAPHLSRWDVAALLYAMSLFTGFFVDLGNIRSHLLQYEHLLY